MPRRARLTVLELGASPTAWVSCRGLGTDDWLVVAQQSDESPDVFSERVQARAHRLGKGAAIESIDIYAAHGSNERGTDARRTAVEGLSSELVSGGRFTLWSPAADGRTDAELAAILADFSPTLAERQIVMNHQSCESIPRSGIRHKLPIGAQRSDIDDFSWDDFGDAALPSRTQAGD